MSCVCAYYDNCPVHPDTHPEVKSQSKSNHHAISNMERATKTYRTRNRVYGNNYKRFGDIMMALYPQGVELRTAQEWNRFGIIIQQISKLSRYVTDPKAGHMDSIHDMGVYSFMLEELDAEQAGLDVTPPVPLVTQGEVVRPADALPNPCEHVYKYPCRKLPEEQWCNLNGGAHTCGLMTCINCGEKGEQ